MVVEKRAKDAEQLATRILEDSEQRVIEMEHLKLELEKAKDAENQAKKKLAALVSNSANVVSIKYYT